MFSRVTSVSAIALVLGAGLMSGTAQAQDAAQSAVPPSPAAAPEPETDQGIQEITVTARRQSESLQKVPDAITAFTAETIANANIKSVADLARVTPGLNFRDGRAFAANFFDLRLRGIGTPQGGWPSVALIVDGVPSDSADALTGGSLADVERIEVLRGPQSALYGSGAIAGAINIITKRPTNTVTAEGRFYYGNGENAQAQGAVSGPLIADKLYARLSVAYVDDNGRINSSTNGINLDPRNRKLVEGRIIFDPTSNFEADLRASYDKERGGYAFQGRVATTAQIDDPDAVVFARRTAGFQTREFTRVAGRLNWDLGAVSLTSVSSYSKTRQYGTGSACYDDVDHPSFPAAGGGELCLSSIAAFGTNAAPGQTQEVYQVAQSNFDTVFQDFRVSSSTGGTFNWLVGASGMRRKALTVGDNYRTVAGNPVNVPLSPRADIRRDRWWGLYGQVGANFGNFELTAAARYDDQKYESTGYSNKTLAVIVPVRNTAGVLEDTQHRNARSFQPKGQISYHIDQDHMLYVTVSRGFRAGYFNVGQYAEPERTTNFEGGFKTQWLDHKLIFNGSVFHIDYSNQQLSTTTNTAPFRTVVIVPKTKIDGTELELAYRLLPTFTVSGNLSYLHAEIADGTTSPKSPRWSGSISGQLNQPLGDGWTLNARSDLSFHSSQYLFTANTQLVGAKQYLNARVGFEKGAVGIYAVGQNLTDTTETQMQTGTTTPYRVVYPVEPRSYGIELRLKY